MTTSFISLGRTRMNVVWLQLLLQRPLVTILLFTLASASILILLQAIAGSFEEEVPHYRHDNNYYDLDRSSTEFASRRRIEDRTKVELSDLETRVNDLNRIRLSVRNELRQLQREKVKILKEKVSLLNRNDRILNQINKNKIQLKQLELDLSANKKQRLRDTCSSDAVIPIVFNPLKGVDLSNFGYTRDRKQAENKSELSNHQLNGFKFNLGLCSLTKRFSFNLTTNQKILKSKQATKSALVVLLLQILESHHYYKSRNDGESCLTLILMEKAKLDEYTESTNNVIINLSGEPIDSKVHRDIMKDAFIVSPSFTRGSMRLERDVVIPGILEPFDSLETILGSSPSQSPLKRKYFASYFGSSKLSNESSPLTVTDRVLQTIHRNSIDDSLLFIYNCDRHENRECYDERERMIELSTFHIIIPEESFDMDPETNNLIYMALSRGSIPVIVGSERVKLPFNEGIDWRLSSILLPSDRLSEIHFILRSLGPADLYSLKYNGWRIFESYMATSKQIVDAIVSLFSVNRLNYPPEPIKPVITKTYFSSQDLKLDVNCTMPACADSKTELMSNLLSSETLGPRERPFKSLAFSRNYSLSLSRTYDLWNKPLFSPKYLFPSHPSDPPSPSEYKFMTLDNNYRPINDGLGGSGSEFSQALGGDYPNEQFTIVLLTYERVPLLMQTLERLKGMAYLNKILIVWNGINQKPREDLVWPDVGVPIVLVKVAENSLNNRFLPYDVIETDAIFSMDDDSPLRQDEIVFGFRVWRESRDRIVGFPGRYHAWDGSQNSWQYNSNHSCELSMVLTGGAFFHRYYLFVYTNLMPSTIRTIVDKFMNCEDIAMNFLVAHLTRKPPIKVTSRWTFHCANCKTSLSKDNSHFMERHECLNIFTSIYGYMPLLSTQHRSDSILFKTRLPRDKQKCFKFV